jgi:hypothetical protein
MRTMARLLALALVAAWFGSPGSGCMPAPPSNLSPTPDQAADRHEQATRYSQDLARRNQEAERKAMSRISRSSPRR